MARPAKKYIKFNGAEDDGFFSYWEKFGVDDKRYSEDNKGQNVQIDISGGIVLEGDLHTVTGYDKRNGFCWSNEVRDVEDELIVRYHGQKRPVATGNWKTVKDEMGDKAKFTKSIYLYLDGEIVNVHLSGGCLNSWFNDIQANRHLMGTNYIRVKSIESGKQGKVEFTFPIFEFGEPIPKSELNAAIGADEEILQPYLDKYFEGATEQKDNDRTDDSPTDNEGWRDFDSREGKLGSLMISSIKALAVALEETGAADTDEYNMVSQALADYRAAMKTWPDKKSKGRSLEDFSLAEITDLYNNIMKQAPAHPSRLFVEAALQAKEEEEAEKNSFDDDDIPF